MALRLQIISRFGFTLPQAYARITSFSGDANDIIMAVTTHANVAARNNNDEEIESQTYNFTVPDTIPAGGIVAWGYDQLKTLPEFVTAIDV